MKRAEGAALRQGEVAFLARLVKQRAADHLKWSDDVLIPVQGLDFKGKKPRPKTSAAMFWCRDELPTGSVGHTSFFGIARSVGVSYNTCIDKAENAGQCNQNHDN